MSEADTSLSDAYDLIDRFLRGSLDDADYAEYSAALDLLAFAAPAAPDHSATVPAEVPMPEAVGTRYDGTKLMAEADVQQYGDAREAAGYARGMAAKGGA